MMHRNASYAATALLAAALTLPLGRAHAEPDSPWGVSVSTELTRVPERWARDMASAGVTSVRGFDANPRGPGVTPLTKAGLAVSGMLWWHSGATQTFPVNDLAGFRRYVISQVSRYKNVVSHWEIWNEPPNFSADKSPASYARIVAEAYDAAKSVDPNIQIGLCAKSVYVKFLAESIAAGARGKFDFICLHPYETAGLLPQGWEGPFLGIVPSVRAMLHKEDPAREHVPVWFTEIGVEVAEAGRPGVSELGQAAVLAKLYTMSIAQGVSRVHWFEPRDSENKTHGLQRRDGTARPALRAFRTLATTLGKAPAYLGYVRLAPDVLGFAFASGKQSAIVAWSRRGHLGKLEAPSPVTLVDLTTGRRTQARALAIPDAPVLLLAPRSSPAAVEWRAATSAEPQPPTWSGDRARQSVALVAGRPPEGIHMIDPPPARVVDGVDELDLSGTTGARFAIDPRFFLAHGSRALRVVAKLRGSGRGRAGFNLKYESRRPLAAANDHGMVGTGHWVTVEGSTPVTLTWDIQDAYFLGKYGANLALDCDSAEFANFSVISLSITKLPGTD